MSKIDLVQRTLELLTGGFPQRPDQTQEVQPPTPGPQKKNQTGLAEKVLACFKPDWEKEWRVLAHLTYGIGKEDARHQMTIDLLEQCDTAFENGNWSEFTRLSKQVLELFQQ